MSISEPKIDLRKNGTHVNNSLKAVFNATLLSMKLKVKIFV